MKRNTFYLIYFITFLVSALAYHTYFENGWYLQDDYLTIEQGGADSVVNATGKISSWLNAQGRFQPVRLFFFAAATHIFQEEYAVIYNFTLHLTNLFLLFLLLRKFNASNVSSLIILLGFSLFGRLRMMESPSAMIGGDGLSLLFILITLIFLIKTSEENDWYVKKIIWYAISLTSYAGLVFSYEVAFPLILVVLYTFIIFQKSHNKHRNPQVVSSYLLLVPYLALLIFYLIFFRRTESSYGGAQIVWSYDILTRFISYLTYTTTYPIYLKAIPEVIIFVVLYFLAISLAAKTDEADVSEPLYSQTANFKLIGFGAIFFFSSIVLFTLNTWGGTPAAIMIHHTYMITVGSSIVIVTSITGLKDSFIEPVKKIYFYFLILCLAPLILAAGLVGNIFYYENQQQRTSDIKQIKYKIQSSIEDPTKIDAILIKNFTHGYYGISSMDGAFLQWFDYRKYIHSGREIVSVLDNKIKFRGPLTYYHPPSEVYDVENERMEMFYLNDIDKKLLTYSDIIDFLNVKNLHQIDQVMEDERVVQQCDKDFVLNAVLKNPSGKDAVVISLGSERDIEGFLKGIRIEVNGKTVKDVLAADKDIYINGVAGIKYIFLKIISMDDRFKSYLNAIKIISILPNFKSKTVQLDGVVPDYPPLVSPTWEWSNGFYAVEKDATHYWRWAAPVGDLSITNSTHHPQKITFKMDIGSTTQGVYDLIINGEFWYEKLRISSKAQPYTKTLIVPPGKHLVRFESNAPGIISPGPRILSYAMENFSVVSCTSR